MALSNIFTEPGRELTESVIGIIASAPVAVFDWRFAVWFAAQNPHDGAALYAGLLLGLLLSMVGVIVTGLVVVGTHVLGESICDALASRGLDPRPRRRR